MIASKEIRSLLAARDAAEKAKTDHKEICEDGCAVSSFPEYEVFCVEGGVLEEKLKAACQAAPDIEAVVEALEHEEAGLKEAGEEIWAVTQLLHGRSDIVNGVRKLLERSDEMCRELNMIVSMDESYVQHLSRGEATKEHGVLALKLIRKTITVSERVKLSMLRLHLDTLDLLEHRGTL